MRSVLPSAILFAVVLAGCTGSGSPSTTAASTATVAPTPTTSPSEPSRDSNENETVAGQSFPKVGFGQPELLNPGRYTTTVMTPTITLEVGAGWQLLGEFEPLLLMSRTVDQFQADALNFVTFPENTIDAVIDRIQSVPVLVDAEPVPASIGGAEGLAFTTAVAVPGGGLAEVFAFPNNRLYNQVPFDPPRFEDGDQVRFTVLEIGDDILTIITAADDSIEFDAFLTAADEVLASISIDQPTD